MVNNGLYTPKIAILRPKTMIHQWMEWGYGRIRGMGDFQTQATPTLE